MASDIPDGLAIERIWVAEGKYGPDAADRRAPVRAEHLVRIDALRRAGTILEAGAFADMSGSIILFRAPSEEAALRLAQDDVYFRTGVWTELRVRALGRVVMLDELPTD